MLDAQQRNPISTVCNPGSRQEAWRQSRTQTPGTGFLPGRAFMRTLTSNQFAGAPKLFPVLSLQPPAGRLVPQLMIGPPIAPNGRPSLSG